MAAFKGRAQAIHSLADSITRKILFYGKHMNTDLLFVHFDKTVYSNNEDVWFTAYLLHTAAQWDKYSFVSVALINSHTRQVETESKIALQNGLASGHLIIPENAWPGPYQLIVYTNVIAANGLPSSYFCQPVFIKTAKQLSFTAALNWSDSVTPGRLHAILQVKPKEQLSGPSPKVIYKIGDNTVTKFTDKSGQLSIDIPSGDAAKNRKFFSATVIYSKDSLHLDLPFPPAAGPPQVKFYPEGGNMVEGYLL